MRTSVTVGLGGGMQWTKLENEPTSNEQEEQFGGGSEQSRWASEAATVPRVGKQRDGQLGLWGVRAEDRQGLCHLCQRQESGRSRVSCGEVRVEGMRYPHQLYAAARFGGHLGWLWVLQNGRKEWKKSGWGKVAGPESWQTETAAWQQGLAPHGPQRPGRGLGAVALTREGAGRQ